MKGSPTTFTCRCTAQVSDMLSDSTCWGLISVSVGVSAAQIELSRSVTVCLTCVWRCSIPPDGLVKGGTEDLVAVLGEAHAGHTFVVGMLKSTQAQTALDLPHLTQKKNTYGFFGGDDNNVTRLTVLTGLIRPHHFLNIEKIQPLFCRSEPQLPAGLYPDWSTYTAQHHPSSCSCPGPDTLNPNSSTQGHTDKIKNNVLVESATLTRSLLITINTKPTKTRGYKIECALSSSKGINEGNVSK